MEAHHSSKLQLGSRDHCVICLVKITYLNRYTSDTNWSNCLKLLTRYCDIEPLQLFDLSEGIRALLMNFMDSDQQLDQLSFSVLCRQCVENVVKLESSLKEMRRAKSDFEDTVWSFRNRLLGGTRNLGQQDKVLDLPTAAGNKWRQQVVAKCVPSNAKLLNILPPFEVVNPPSDVERVIDEILANTSGETNMAAGMTSITNCTAKVARGARDNARSTTHLAAATGIPAHDDASMASFKFESDENDVRSTTTGTESVDTDTAVDSYEKSQSQSSTESLLRTPTSDVQNPFPSNADCNVANGGPHCSSSFTLHSESDESVVSGKRKRREPERLSYAKDFFGCKNSRVKKSAKVAKKPCPIDTVFGLKCTFCLSNFQDQDDLEFHELLMHPFEKLWGTLPPNTCREDIILARDYYVNCCKKKSKSAGPYKCIYCDLSYGEQGTRLSELKIHFFKDHRDKVEHIHLLLRSLDIVDGDDNTYDATNGD